MAISERLKKLRVSVLKGLRSHFSSLIPHPSSLIPHPSKFPLRNLVYIPVVIKTSLDLPPLWGRLVRLWPEGAELISKFEIKKGRIIALYFELGGNDYEDIRAAITGAAKESSGYFVYKLAFKDSNQIKAFLDAIRKSTAAVK